MNQQLSGANAHALTHGMSNEWPPAVAWYAVIGVIFAVMGFWAMGQWMFSADFHPAPLGAHPDPIPGYVIPLIRTVEIGNVLGFIWVIYFCHKCNQREGRLSLETALMLGWALQYWTDPTIQWIRPMFFYNAYFINMQNWSSFIPGWVNPTSHGYPSPLLYQGLTYFFYFLIVTLMISWVMRQAKRLRPHWGPVRLIAVGIVFSILWDLLMELIWIRTHLYAYPNAIYSLSVWGGTVYQFPIYEAIFWGMVNGATGVLYYFRDDRGNTIVDRGLERIKSVRMRGPIRVLAISGFISIPFWIYIAVMVLFSLHGDPMPKGYPSWLVNGACGAGTSLPCPGPNSVIAPFTEIKPSSDPYSNP